MRKTKTTTAHTEVWNTVETHSFWYGSKPARTQTYGRTYNVLYPANTITYDIGPEYIGDKPRHCNWKYCHHVGFSTQFSGASYSCQQYGIPKNPSGQYHQFDAHGVNPFFAGLSFPDASAVAPIDIEGLADKMYADLVGRVDSSFLSLESLAGLFGGQSFAKTIGGLATASNMLAKAIRDLNKLRAAFGRKASLYNMWLSSKELVRQVMGFDLGYRFAFKATLSDIVEAVDAVTRFQHDVQRLSFRNDGRVHQYVKDSTNNSVAESSISGADFRKAFLRAFPVSPNPVQNLPVDAVPPALLRCRETAHAKLFTWAKVEYPKKYITATRILQSRFGLDKPLSTLWAIVPCSFVVDYLVRVQDLLSSIDDKLNEMSVSVKVFDAWLLTSKTRVYEIDWPGVYNRVDGGSWERIVNCPALHARQKVGNVFTREPFTVGNIMSKLGPLFRTDSENWTTRIGTGLELLLTRRLR